MDPWLQASIQFPNDLGRCSSALVGLEPGFVGSDMGTLSAIGLREAAQIWVGPSPTLSNQPPPQELEQMLHVARKFDVAGRDERNRALGRAGEERVVAHERSALKVAGRDDLARKGAVGFRR